MKILRFKEAPSRDEYFRNLMLKYVVNNKLIRLAETIFDQLEIEYKSLDDLIDIKELIRITFEECKNLHDTSTLESLRQEVLAEIGEEFEM